MLKYLLLGMSAAIIAAPAHAQVAAPGRAAPARAETAGTVTFALRLGDASSGLDVATYFDPTSMPHKVGLLHIRTSAGQNSIAFKADDWRAAQDLWAKAVAAQSTSWHTVGTYDETGTTDPSVLTISAGVGVNVVISSPAKGAVTYTVAPSDMGSLGATLQKVQESLANQSSE
jgi:hypothetical protein